MHFGAATAAAISLLSLSLSLSLFTHTRTHIYGQDFARYNEEGLTAEERAEANREMKEETGWKLIYADVFRPPPQATLLSVYAGTGVQLVIMAVLVLCFAALGFLSPANRGSLLSAALFFFVLMGVPAGYVSARFCKLVKEPNHFKATLLTALMFPGVCFGIFFLINLVAWSRQSSTAVPFGTLIVLMLLWCVCVCVCVHACVRVEVGGKM